VPAIPPDLVFSLFAHLTHFKLGLAAHRGLNLRELLLLTTVALSGPVSFKELHQLLAVSKSALSGMVSQMYQRRLVNRRQDTRDRRRWLVSLTARGQRLLEEIQAEEKRLVETALEGLADSDQAAFLRAVEALHEQLVHQARERPRAAPSRASSRKKEAATLMP
jgi:DNA-binding MarR family transcriptional regulator